MSSGERVRDVAGFEKERDGAEGAAVVALDVGIEEVETKEQGREKDQAEGGDEGGGEGNEAVLQKRRPSSIRSRIVRSGPNVRELISFRMPATAAI